MNRMPIIKKKEEKKFELIWSVEDMGSDTLAMGGKAYGGLPLSFGELGM